MLADYRSATLPRIYGAWNYCARRILHGLWSGQDYDKVCEEQIRLIYDIIAEPFDDSVKEELQAKHNAVLTGLCIECTRIVEDRKISPSKQDELCSARIVRCYEQLIQDLMSRQEDGSEFFDRLVSCIHARLNPTDRDTVAELRQRIEELNGQLYDKWLVERTCESYRESLEKLQAQLVELRANQDQAPPAPTDSPKSTGCVVVRTGNGFGDPDYAHTLSVRMGERYADELVGQGDETEAETGDELSGAVFEAIDRERQRKLNRSPE